MRHSGCRIAKQPIFQLLILLPSYEQERPLCTSLRANYRSHDLNHAACVRQRPPLAFYGAKNSGGGGFFEVAILNIVNWRKNFEGWWGWICGNGVNLRVGLSSCCRAEWQVAEASWLRQADFVEKLSVLLHYLSRNSRKLSP